MPMDTDQTVLPLESFITPEGKTAEVGSLVCPVGSPSRIPTFVVKAIWDDGTVVLTRLYDATRHYFRHTEVEVGAVEK